MRRHHAQNHLDLADNFATTTRPRHRESSKFVRRASIQSIYHRIPDPALPLSAFRAPQPLFRHRGLIRDSRRHIIIPREPQGRSYQHRSRIPDPDRKCQDSEAIHGGTHARSSFCLSVATKKPPSRPLSGEARGDHHGARRDRDPTAGDPQLVQDQATTTAWYTDQWRRQLFDGVSLAIHDLQKAAQLGWHQRGNGPDRPASESRTAAINTTIRPYPQRQHQPAIGFPGTRNGCAGGHRPTALEYAG
jgi:hypothetical protein